MSASPHGTGLEYGLLSLSARAAASFWAEWKGSRIQIAALSLMPRLLGFIVLGLTPEAMGKGNWLVGVIADDRASTTDSTRRFPGGVHSPSGRRRHGARRDSLDRGEGLTAGIR